MITNTYLIKNLAPWMMDELIAFSKISRFKIIFLRKQSSFYQEGIGELKQNGVEIINNPFSWKNISKKLLLAFSFFFSNGSKFGFNYNGVIGLKSIWWFLKLDMSLFSEKSNIHAQFATQAAIISLIIKKYYGDKPKYSFTFHAYDIYFNNKWFAYLVQNAHKAFSISQYNIDYVKDKFINSDKIILSRLGVNRQEIQKDSQNIKKLSDKFEIGLISWFVEKKGIIYLLQAIKQIKEEEIKSIHLKIAGDGPLKNEFLSYVKENNLETCVEFVGKVKGQAKDDFFNGLNAFVLPSISLKNDQDGIPVVLMEAIAYGLPMISTDVSGIPEICINDYNGYLIPEKDVESLYKAIIKLSKDKTKYQLYSKNALELSKEYDIDINSKNKIMALAWN